MANQAQSLVFSPLPAEALEELSAARGFVAQTISDLLGISDLSHSGNDLSILQALVDHPAMKNANFEAWVAVGIAFGDALVSHIPGLHWRHVSDQLGEHVALQFDQKLLSIAAPTMLWKRKKRGEQIKLDHLAAELRSVISNRAHEYGNA